MFKILSDLSKKITPSHSYVKLKAYEAEYILDYVEATRVALDDALNTLASDEREERFALIEKAQGMRNDLNEVSTTLRARGILSEGERT